MQKTKPRRPRPPTARRWAWRIGSERARLLQRGLAGLTRVGSGYLNAIVNGPAGLLKRGANIEVPVGSVIHTVILLDVPATNRT